MVHQNEKITELLTGVNAGLPDDKKIEVEKAVGALVALGCGVEGVAKEMKFEEIQEATGVTLPIARAIAMIWRAEEPKAPAVEAPAAPAAAPEMAIGGATGNIAEFAMAFGNVSALNDITLLSNYDPQGRDDIIAELAKRSRNLPFIVFVDKTKLEIDVKRSHGNLKQLKLGVALGETTMIDGRLTSLYRSGELPDMALPVCPIHECHLVGVDEMCPICERAWKDVSTESRELAYMQAQDVWGEMPANGDPRLMQLFQALKDPKDQYFNKAALRLEEHRATGQPIVLVKPVKQVTPIPAPQRRR